MPAVTTAVAVIGAGVAGAGFFMSSSAAEEQARIQKQILAAQQQIENEKKKAMELDASRRTLEVFRGVQRAKSVAAANAVAQGAQFSSGLLGGQAQAQGEGNYALLGIGQNLQIGRQIFQYNKEITDLKGQLADANADAQIGAGLTSLGMSLMGNAGNIGKMFSGFGSSNMSGYSGSQLPNSAMTSGYGYY